MVEVESYALCRCAFNAELEEKGTQRRIAEILS